MDLLEIDSCSQCRA